MPPLHIIPTATLSSQLEITPKETSINGNRNFTSGDNYSATRKPKWNIVWRNVIVFSILHLISLYGIYIMIFKNKWYLFIYAYTYGIIISQGITAGAHRLWSHRAYKVKFPLKLILLFLQTSSFQNSVYVWVRDHRAHHKFTDTEADPHNAQRGFFFSHMGWLLLRKEDKVKIKGKTIDMSDITSDPHLMLQHRYYFPLMVVCCFIIPTMFPYLWGETYWDSFATGGAFRYIYSVHVTWLVNSAAHIYGMKPYDSSIKPSENKFVSLMTCGEGFHNYHHVFPWDYKTSELGKYGLNWTLAVINFFAKIGWAYDLKTVSQEVIAGRIKRTGDGSWKHRRSTEPTEIWGWGDTDMQKEDVDCAMTLNRIK